jgi:crotonobetainyl-CoA:carnitine CoA-transferase CaiB-like acyl-CoA transferase
MKNHGTRYPKQSGEYQVIEKDGVVYIVFTSTGEWRPASKEVLEEEGFAESAVQQEARDRHSAETIREYIEARKRRTPEEIAEEQFEIRAAFGPGQDIVNVFTGEITKT